MPEDFKETYEPMGISGGLKWAVEDYLKTWREDILKYLKMELDETSIDFVEGTRIMMEHENIETIEDLDEFMNQELERFKNRLRDNEDKY